MYWALMLILAGLIAILLWIFFPHRVDTRNPENFTRLFHRVRALLFPGAVVLVVIIVLVLEFVV